MTTTPGEEELLAQLEEAEAALRAFADPEAETRPGLRLTHDALRRKHAAIEAKLEDGRTVALELVVAPDEPPREGVVAAVAAALLATAQEAVTALGRALAHDDADPDLVDRALALSLAGGGSGDAGLRLVAPPPGPRRAVPAPDEHPSLVEAAIAALLDVVAGDRDDDADAVTGLAEVVARSGSVVALRLDGEFAAPREVRLEPVRAADLAAP